HRSVVQSHHPKRPTRWRAWARCAHRSTGVGQSGERQRAFPDHREQSAADPLALIAWMHIEALGDVHQLLREDGCRGDEESSGSKPCRTMSVSLNRARRRTSMSILYGCPSSMMDGLFATARGSMALLGWPLTLRRTS